MYTLGDFVPKKKILHHLFVQSENNFIQASSHALLNKLIRILHTNQRIHQTVLGETLPIALKHQKNIGSISSKLHMTVS